jgi:hypothetical protein
MMKKALALSIGIAVSLPTLATQFNANGARSMAMGGVGVASGRGVEAAFYNPALLSKQKNDDYELILPYFSLDAADDDNLIDEFDDFDDKVDELDEALDAFNDVLDNRDSANAVPAAERLGSALGAIDRELASFNNKALRVDPGIGAGFAMPEKNLGIALFAYNETKIAGRFLYAPTDSGTISDYSSTLENVGADLSDGNIDLADYYADLDDDGNPIPGTGIVDPRDNKLVIPNLQSSIAMVGLAISEIGVAFSHEFDFSGHAIALGVTPKLVRVDSALLNIIAVEEDDEGDLSSGLDDFDDEFDDAKADDTNANVDVGAAYQMGQWMFGATVRNLIPVDYDLENDTIRDLVYEMKPHARAGASWSNDWIVVATDVDLTEQETLIPNVNLDTRFLSVGAEFKLWDTLFLRAGYRDNLGSAELDTLTVGFGLDFGLTLDFAAIVSEDGDEAGFSAQIGGRW